MPNKYTEKLPVLLYRNRAKYQGIMKNVRNYLLYWHEGHAVPTSAFAAKGKSSNR
jgi:hypothetical protein